MYLYIIEISTILHIESHLIIFSLTRNSLNQTEAKSTRILFLFCICYFLFGTPIMICNIIHGHGFHVDEKNDSAFYYIYFISYCLYWSQYSLNFFIYAARNKQYRRAYIYFLKKVISI